MKAKSWIPLTIIGLGLILLGIGLWQQMNMKIKTKETLNIAKSMVNEPLKTPIRDKNNKVSKISSGDTIGLLVIPRINSELAIVEGTDPDDLEKGVGHYKGSFLPGGHGQIVLSGHRDTVFRHLGELKIGDSLLVKLSTGVYSYKITHMKIVDSKDTSVITLQNKKEELILTTCYPFRYIGNAPKRYIIYANPS
jgi:sortase A